MNEITPKFNIYEQLGYLGTGGILAVLIVFNNFFFEIGLPLPVLTATNLLVWVLVIYFFGHLLQALTNFFTKIWIIKYWFEEYKGRKTENQESIIRGIKQKFNLHENADIEAWEICYLFALSKDETNQINQFNSQYGMYRGWSLLFLLNALFYVVLFFTTKSHCIHLLLFFAGSLFVSYLFRLRFKRFWEYIGTKVYATYALYKGN